MSEDNREKPSAQDARPPLCFVLMPFGRKTDATGRTTDFDAVYQEIIAPAVVGAGLEPIRADEEKVGGTIHKPMFERLMLCPYAVADITGANPNVYYELGIRHALRPRATVILFAEGTTLPFDIAPLRGIPYGVNEEGVPKHPEICVGRVAAQLAGARTSPHDDSPLFQLVTDLPRPGEVAHSITDDFHKKYNYSKPFKERLLAARLRKPKAAALAAVKEVAADPALANLLEVEAGVVVDLFLSYRDAEGYDEMIALFKHMPEPLKRARVVREQYAFALNRAKRSEEAEAVLQAVLSEFGPSSETNGLLGRIYKDRWDKAVKAGDAFEAAGHLEKAIETYLAGFQADWRDAYPGVNAVTLMEMMEEPDPRQAEVLPVVRYSASQKAAKKADYWDHATLLELAVLGRDQKDAMRRMGAALAAARPEAPWETETTERNLRLIRQMREKRGEQSPWILKLEEALAKKRQQ
jgi:hypothetical protein